MQEISVRNIRPEDIERLHAIRTNRQVAEFQLPPCSIHRWRRQIEGAENTPGLSYRCTTILVSGEVAGLDVYKRQAVLRLNGQRRQRGRNLHRDDA